VVDNGKTGQVDRLWNKITFICQYSSSISICLQMTSWQIFIFQTLQSYNKTKNLCNIPLMASGPLANISTLGKHLNIAVSHATYAVVELRWARGGLAHLKDLAAPAKHLFCWEDSRGPVKGPWNCKMITHYLLMLYCNLQVFFVLKLQ